MQIDLSSLINKNCVSYNQDSLALNPEEIAQYSKVFPLWNLEYKEDIPSLEKKFSFKKYLDSIKFVQEIAEMAENQNHHPNIYIGYRKVKLSWFTHDLNGLHKNDFICAARSDLIFSTL